jgi:two-component system phosphate regulon sensor histidine kinase PhoR
MKRSTIWIIAIVMGLSFVVLLALQISYIEEMAKMKREQFEESVHRALYQAAHNMELNETLHYLEKNVQDTESKAIVNDSVTINTSLSGGGVQKSHQYSVVGDDGTIYSSFQLQTVSLSPRKVSSGLMVKRDREAIAEAQKSMQEIVRNRYLYQRGLLDEVVYSILYTASDKPLKERVNFRQLDQDIRTELLHNGINMPYHFTVTTNDGNEIYRCPDYDEEGSEYSFTQVLFKNDHRQKQVQ